MSGTQFVEIILTCGSWQEAQAIADALLEKHLVACAEFIEIKSKYWWERQLEEAKEIKLIMATIAANFDKVEAEVKELHSYKTFVLQMLPIEKLSAEAAEWLSEETSI